MITIYELPTIGLHAAASNGLGGCARRRQPLEDAAGLTKAADKATNPLPAASSPSRERGGQKSPVQMAHIGSASPARDTPHHRKAIDNERPGKA